MDEATDRCSRRELFLVSLREKNVRYRNLQVSQKSLEKSKGKSGFTGAPDFLEISFFGAAVA